MSAPVVLPDPEIERGPFKALPYAPGGFVIVDTRREAGDQAVAHVPTLRAALHRVLRLASEAA